MLLVLDCVFDVCLCVLRLAKGMRGRWGVLCFACRGCLWSGCACGGL